MIERRRRFRFLRESFDALAIVGEIVRKNFESDVASEAFVVRAIDIAHAAGADQRIESIRSDGRSGRKCLAHSFGDLER